MEWSKWIQVIKALCFYILLPMLIYGNQGIIYYKYASTYNQYLWFPSWLYKPAINFLAANISCTGIHIFPFTLQQQNEQLYHSLDQNRSGLTGSCWTSFEFQNWSGWTNLIDKKSSHQIEFCPGPKILLQTTLIHYING